MTRLTDYFNEQSILFFEDGVPKEKIFTALIGTLRLNNASLALEAIFKREAMGSTQIADNIAVPHARLNGLKRLKAALGITRGKSLTLLFVGSSDNLKEHLEFLAEAAAQFQNETLVTSLIHSTEAAAAIQLLQNAFRDVEQGGVR